MHRDGSGKKIQDIVAFRAQLVAEGRTKKSYPNLGEWRAYPEIYGEVVAEDDTHQLIANCDLKGRTRGGTPLIDHNCCLLWCKGVTLGSISPNIEPERRNEKYGVFYPMSDLENIKMMCFSKK